MASLQTKGQLESEIAKAVTQFEREHLGRGPREVRAWIIQDLIIVRLKRVLTPAEEKLARDPEGRGLVKEMRRQLIEGSREVLDEIILNLTGVHVVSLHSEISVRTGERIIVFTMAEDLEKAVPALVGALQDTGHKERIATTCSTTCCLEQPLSRSWP